MKNKKIIYYIAGGIILLLIIIGIVLFINKKDNKNLDNDNNTNNNTTNNTDYNNSKTLLEAVIKKNNKTDGYYKKITNADVLNTDTCFRNYAFISNNSIYIYDYTKLDNGEFVYKKVYDVPSDIKVMNIVPGSGSDISFYDYSDIKYTLQDENTDNKVRDSYDMYLNANYKLSDYLKWEYSKEFLGQKIDYDFMSNYVYSKDNTLYAKIYGNERYPSIEKINGNYEGEKLIRIYNEKILKTDKGFYEIIKYFDKEQNKTIYTTMKIKLLSKYYSDVLTFTYKYVILKDYTIIPINDIIVVDRFHDYQYSYYIEGPNYETEIPKVFEE